MTSWTVESLRAFEDRVKDAFLRKEVHAPIHLSGGNEKELIDIFKLVRPHDWVFSTWRSHYHALLKGIPEAWVYDEIVAGRSMYLMSREHKFFCSAIVGGILPIAAGVALATARNNLPERLWVFVGDMTATTGLFYEFNRYASLQRLPVLVVIEDNGLSTDTPTAEAWGTGKGSYVLQHYRYDRRFPHVGVGEHVEF